MWNRLGHPLTTASATLIDISSSGARLKPVSGIRRNGALRIAQADGRTIEATVAWVKSDPFGVKFKDERAASSSVNSSHLSAA